MSSVAEIEAAIEQLPPQEQRQLRERILKEEKQLSIWDKLQSLAGKAKGLPPDMAANHDHYLHGLPKRVP
jgi:hypothetical protein